MLWVVIRSTPPIKTYVVGTYYKRLGDALLMTTHNTCYKYGELEKIIQKISSTTTYLQHMFFMENWRKIILELSPNIFLLNKPSGGTIRQMIQRVTQTEV